MVAVGAPFAHGSEGTSFGWVGVLFPDWVRKRIQSTISFCTGSSRGFGKVNSPPPRPWCRKVSCGSLLGAPAAFLVHVGSDGGVRQAPRPMATAKRNLLWNHYLPSVSYSPPGLWKIFLLLSSGLKKKFSRLTTPSMK
jgi:hypothetical protein